MDPDKSTPIILRLGGSIISHSNKIIDFGYLREFRDLLQEKIIMGRRFVLILGGGQMFRDLLEHVKEQGSINDIESQHWIGTAVNTVHAYIVRAFLGDELAEKHVWKFEDIEKIPTLEFNKPIAVAGGFEAGMSSDGVAMKIAAALHIKDVYDLKNIDGVYEKDPKTNPKAQKFDQLTWDEYLKLIGNPETHQPGGSFPVDPIAAKEAKALGARYFILKATDFDNLDKALSGEVFTGTTIG